MRYAVFFLLYSGVFIRAIAFNYYDDPVPASVYAYLVVYGLLLITEPLLTPRLQGYPALYLIIQTGLVMGMMLTIPSMDFLPSLFLPLSFLAVIFMGRRRGFLWISAFILLMAGPLLVGWEWQLPGIAILVINGIACFFVGSYAHLIQRAQQAQTTNQELLSEVQVAYRKLQDHAAQVEELAILQERRRMARELHDSVTQTIFSINLTVQAARLLTDKDPDQVRGQLERVQELAHSAMGEIQVLVEQLRPRTLTADGLPTALRRLSAERQKRDGLLVRLEIHEGQELPPPVTIGLYRIVQEALNNITKHAGVREAEVRLDMESHPASLEVEDHGCGFEPDQAARDIEHVGLAGMADRARELGWRLEISSAPGVGTRIRVEEAAA
jgi:signal transduction histidine kinase